MVTCLVLTTNINAVYSLHNSTKDAAKNKPKSKEYIKMLILLRRTLTGDLADVTAGNTIFLRSLLYN